MPDLFGCSLVCLDRERPLAALLSTDGFQHVVGVWEGAAALALAAALKVSRK